ncbi:acyltransferase [Sporolactobacillus sp. THM19-2]|uniref:acyltransferase n=1 Tax=Sporolactobacillus sp. THM19-2 TaxID=2511171 RepID=UPI0013EC0C81|nr:acyltransferase family protein [Sporolactobacillus sp. THM19-2]
MKKRVLYMDLLACVSALFVVVLHSTLTVFNFRVDRSWLESLLIQSFFHWPVPIFFMLSGANLLSYRERYSTSTFFKKRIKRVLIPFLIWSFIWAVFNYLKGWMPDFSIKHIAKLFLYNNIQNIFWFFYTILGIYLCIPILSLIAKKENKKLIQYFIVLCLLQTGVIPIVFGMAQQPVPWYTSLPLVGGFLSYVLTGWYLVTFSINKKMRYTIYLLGFISGIAISIGTYYFSLPTKQLNQLFFEYNSIFVYFLSVAVFVLFQSIKWDSLITPKLTRWLTIISSTSFGVYIIHFFVIIELDRYFHVDNTSLYYMTVHPVIVFAISSLTVYFMKRMPLIKHIMP